MKKMLFMVFAFFTSISVMAQKCASDSLFHVYLYNEEYQVYLDLDLFGASIKVPGQDVFGEVPGFLGAIRDSRKWLITSADVIERNKATLSITNDYGSEDLNATLIYDAVSDTYMLKQVDGSRIKIVVNRKWVKLPTELKFVRHERVSDSW